MVGFKEHTAYSIKEACGIIGKRLYKKDFAWIDIKSGDKRYVWMQVQSSAGQLIWAWVDERLSHKSPESFNVRYDDDPTALIEIDDDKYLYVDLFEEK